MPRRPAKNMTAVQAKKLKVPGKYACGEGLYLLVNEDADGGVIKRWYWRGTIDGRRSEVGIGPYSEWSLLDAREKAIEYRKIARSGNDPKRERNKDKNVVLTFKEAAYICHKKSIAPGLTNKKHIKQWIGTLENYVFPKIGNRPINAITQEEIINLIAPIWLEKHETARRTLQRTKRVFDWARPRSDCGISNQMNPANVPREALPIVPNLEERHFAALSHEELPALMVRLKGIDLVSAFALRFLILCGSRAIEVRGAQWVEIDINKRLWIIPGERMKRKREHIVPLSPPAIEILTSVEGLSDELVFPSNRDPYKMMSDSTMNSLLVRLGVPRKKTTVHGFRTTFRIWAEEETEFSHLAKETALSHAIKNKTEAAYLRTTLVEKRKLLMNEWAKYATSG